MLIGASLKEIHKKRKTFITRKNPKFSTKFQKIRKVKSPNQKNPKAGKTSAFSTALHSTVCVCAKVEAVDIFKGLHRNFHRISFRGHWEDSAIHIWHKIFLACSQLWGRHLVESGLAD